MTRLCKGGLATMAQLLLDAYRCATSTPIGKRAALYLVRLSEPAGLSLAVAVHAVTGGPDPVALRDRARRDGVKRPVLAGAVQVDSLAAALEGLGVMDDADRRLLGWTVLEVHRCAEVPVLVMLDGTAIVTSLSAFTTQGSGAEPFAWSLPAVGEA